MKSICLCVTLLAFGTYSSTASAELADQLLEANEDAELDLLEEALLCVEDPVAAGVLAGRGSGMRDDITQPDPLDPNRPYTPPTPLRFCRNYGDDLPLPVDPNGQVSCGEPYKISASRQCRSCSTKCRDANVPPNTQQITQVICRDVSAPPGTGCSTWLCPPVGTGCNAQGLTPFEPSTIFCDSNPILTGKQECRSCWERCYNDPNLPPLPPGNTWVPFMECRPQR